MSDSDKTHKIFVYGTLKKGEPNYFRLQDENVGSATFLGDAKLMEKYPMVIVGRYNVPALLSEPGKGKEIFGELYEVDDKMLEHLDWLENHPESYERTPSQCIMLDSNKQSQDGVIECQVYMVFGFKPHLLSLTHISSYSSATDEENRYRPRNEREDDNYGFKKDLK